MEENNKKRQLQRAVFVFTLVVCLSAIAGGLGSATFSNYFKEVYHVDSAQRGFLEIPRESPGVLCALIISALAGFSDIGIAAVSQVLVMVGLMVMGAFSPVLRHDDDFSVYPVFGYASVYASQRCHQYGSGQRR